MQNYLAFIGGFLPKAELLARTAKLPSDLKEGNLYTFGDFHFFIIKNENPLCRTFIHAKGSVLYIITGFFYSEINERLILECSDKSPAAVIRKLLRLLNGSFIIIAADINENTVIVKSDALGFEKCFYKTEQNKIVVSSSIWPLTDKSGLHTLKVAEHLAFGHCLGERTIFPGIGLFQPAFISTLSCNGIKKEFIPALASERHEALSGGELTENLFGLAGENWVFIKSMYNDDSPQITLTGGGETRVILNSLLNNKIRPAAFTGSQPAGDIERASKISKHFGLKHFITDFDEHLTDYWKSIDRIVVNSNGTTNGWWMSLLAKEALRTGRHLYYGFSGDFIAGNKILDISSYNEAKLVRAMKYKSMYDFFDAAFFAKMTGLDTETLINSYLNSFKQLPDNDEILFEHERNEFNFKRISSFADGAREGAMPVLFFHDRRILEFYRSLGKNELKYEKFHKKAACANNEFLMSVSSSGKSNKTQSFENLMLKLFGKNLLRELYELRKSVSLTKNNVGFNFRDHVFFDYEGPCLDADIVDWSYIREYFDNSKMSLNDLEVLKMRIWDISLAQGAAKDYRAGEYRVSESEVQTGKNN